MLVKLVCIMVSLAIQFCTTVPQLEAEVDDANARMESMSVEMEQLREELDLARMEASEQYETCGTCGAHVKEWWWIHGAELELVPVCRYCYQYWIAME